MYNIYAIRVFSFQWDESLAFYRDTIQFPAVFADAEIGWAQFDLGGAYLGLERCARDDEESKDLVGRFVGASIEVENIQATYASLVGRGVKFLGPPAKQPWGGTLAHFEDPDGNILTLLGDLHQGTVSTQRRSSL